MNLSSLRTRPVRRALLLTGSFLVIALVSALLSGLRYLDTPIAALAEPAVFEVSAGSSFSRVSRELAAKGYLERPRLFRLLARWRGVENSIKAGEYRLEAGLSPDGLLETLVQGDSLQYRVTLVEGWTVKQALEALWASDRIEREIAEYDPQQLADLLGVTHGNPEGLLFPDTYFYTAGTTDVQLLRRAHDRLETVLASAWEQRLGALPFATPYEALTLASIIEKESAFGAERGHIAGVFVRRLETGMRLQSDPTVIYGLQDAFDGNLTRRDLTQETPYNTYRVGGLPPTPIALAGLDSIVASLHPLQSDYLYFVAKGDGEHYFSSTLEEHNEAVRRYQIAPATQ